MSNLQIVVIYCLLLDQVVPKTPNSFLCLQNMVFCLYLHSQRESSSVGRARPCQGRGREFESRLSLKALPLKSWALFLKG